MYSQITLVNRMQVSDFDAIVVVPQRPVLGAYRINATGVEGSSIIFEVRRSGVQTGGCTCTWTAVSVGGTADISGASTGTVTFGNNVTDPQRVTVQTVNRAGTQGDRDLVVTISNPQGCDLDPTRLSAVTTLKDRTASVYWWQLASTRGGRTDKRASGPSYWAATGSQATANFKTYENKVGLMDAFCGGNSEKGGNFNDTMLLTTGGPTDSINDTITSGSALDWSKNNSHWTTGWRNAAKGCWCVWAVNMTSVDERTDQGDNSIWQDIIDGKWRYAYISMGKRIAKNIDSTDGSNPKGHEANRLILRLNHENNQSNYYQVVAAYKLKYKQAMELAIGWIKEGLGDYSQDVKFAHAPAHGNVNLGDYDSWAPDNVDIYSVSWHPTNTLNTVAKVNAYMDGTDTPYFYSPKEVMELARARATPTPTMFPEWSPKDEWNAKLQNACPLSNTAVQLFDQFLTDNQDWCVCDCVYSKASKLEMLDPNGYEKTDDAAGVQQWKDMVTTFKNQWGKPNKGPA